MHNQIAQNVDTPNCQKYSRLNGVKVSYYIVSLFSHIPAIGILQILRENVGF